TPGAFRGGILVLSRRIAGGIGQAAELYREGRAGDARGAGVRRCGERTGTLELLPASRPVWSVARERRSQVERSFDRGAADSFFFEDCHDAKRSGRLTMRRIFAVLMLAALAFAAGPGYKVVEKIKVGGDGGWDYVYIDSAAQRLYASHTNRVEVVD